MKNLLFLLFIFVFYSVGTISQTDKAWKTTYTFSGNSNEDTDDFTIKSSKWRIVWSANKQYEDVYGGNFIVHLVDSDSEEDLVINTIPSDEGTTIIRKKGTFYFKIMSFITNWKMEIQEYQTPKKK